MTLLDPTAQPDGSLIGSAPLLGDPLVSEKLDALPSFDINSVDRKLQRIGTIETAWDLPPLPDEVKLDLAMQHETDHESIGNFLWGVWSDLNEAVKFANPLYAEPAGAAEATPASSSALTVPSQAIPQPFELDPNNWRNQMRRYWAGVAGDRAPQLVDVNAVQSIKNEAIRMGILEEPADGVVDGRWTPEMRGVQAEMLSRSMNSRLSGDKPGSVTVDELGRMMGRWMTPSGLLNAAVEFDLWFDPGNIVREKQQWGNKWREFTRTPTVGKLWDAILGPVDDVVVPIVNDVLLFAGVSELVMFSRGALAARAGVTALEGAEVGRGLFATMNAVRNETALGRAIGLGSRYDAAADLALFERPSMLSGFVSKVPAIGESASAGMNAWRANEYSMIAKKSVQTGMKLGIVSRLEDRLPGYQGGMSAGTVGRATGIDDYFNHLSANPLTHGAQFAMDLTFMPPTIFGQGALTNAFRSARSSAVKALSLDVSQNEKLAAATGKALHAKLVESFGASEDPAMVDLMRRFNDAFQKQGPRAAMVEFFGDEELAGNWMLWILGNAAVHGQADASVGMQLANKAGKARNPADFRRWWTFARNKSISQLKEIEADDIIGYAVARAWNESTYPGGRVKLARQYIARASTAEGRAEMDAFIAHHQDVRRASWNNMLSDVQPHHISNVIDAAWDTIGNHGAFLAANAEVEAARAGGLLDNLYYRPAYSGEGREMVSDVVELSAPSRGRRLSMYPRSKEANFELNAPVPRPTPIATRHVDVLAESIEPGKGTLTIAAKDGVFKQHAVQFEHYVKTLLERREVAQEFLDPVRRAAVEAELQPVLERLATSGRMMRDFEMSTINAWIDDLVTSPDMNLKTKRLAKLMHWASQNKYPIHSWDEMATAIDRDIAAVSGHHVWSSMFGIGPDLTVAPGESLLRAQLRELRKAKNWMASEVDLTANPELAALAARLNDHGYTLVHGVQFLGPHDLAGLDGAFVEVSKNTMRKISLGSFFGRQEPAMLKTVRDNTLKQTLAGNINAAIRNGHWNATSPTMTPDSPELDQVMEVLHNYLNDARNVSDEALKRAATAKGPFGRFAANAVHGGIPFHPVDMTPRQIRDALVQSKIAPESATNYIWKALREARGAGGYKLNGLMQLESNLRANDNVEGILKVMSRSPISTAVKNVREAQTPAQYGKAAMHLGFSTALGPRAVLGAYVGGAAGDELGGGDPTARALGAIGGAIALPYVTSKGAQSVLKAYQGTRWQGALAAHPMWARYTHLADELAFLRDTFRFRLNPFFDLRRYSKSFVLAHLEEMPEGFQAPMTWSRRSFVKQYGESEMSRMRELFKEINKNQVGTFDPDILEGVSAAWHQNGILSFNPSERMSSMFGHLVKQGVDQERAYQIARNVYTYGTSGRSAMEKSVNFVFFPFSFEKKLLTAGAKFLSKDMSRVAFLHDSLKAYEILNEKYDLSTLWEEHLPFLHQLQKLNAFDHGIGPGELGGVNRPIIEFALSAAGKSYMGHSPIVNAFLPQGVSIGSNEEAESFSKLMDRLLPVRNQIESLLDDAAEQGHVMFASSHRTRRAEIDRGYAEATELRDEVERAALENNVKGGLRSVMAASPDMPLYKLKQYYEQKRSDIASRNPAWIDSLDQSVARRTHVEREANMLAADAMRRVESGAPQPGDIGFLRFLQQDATAREALSSQGSSVDSHPDVIDPRVFETMRNFAFELAKTDPKFLDLYRRFFARTWGPIQREYS